MVSYALRLVGLWGVFCCSFVGFGVDLSVSSTPELERSTSVVCFHLVNHTTHLQCPSDLFHLPRTYLVVRSTTTGDQKWDPRFRTCATPGGNEHALSGGSLQPDEGRHNSLLDSTEKRCEVCKTQVDSRQLPSISDSRRRKFPLLTQEVT